MPTPRPTSTEIHRLKAVRSAGFTFAELQAEQSAREVHGDVAIVQAWEIAGHGSQLSVVALDASRPGRC
jgi:hypothetical protein